jgi:hypothetical protein
MDWIIREVIEIELQPFDISKKGGFSLNSLPITP